MWRISRNREAYYDVTYINLTLGITKLYPDKGFEECPIRLDTFLLWLNDDQKMPFAEQVIYIRQLAQEYREALTQEGLL